MIEFKLKIRIFLWSILSVIIITLLYLGIVPNGKISYTSHFDKDSEFISNLTPKERMEGELYPKVIIGNPVYFSLHTPRSFDKAVLHLRYKEKISDNLINPIIEAGTLVDKTIWRYNLQPVENKIIDSVSLVWNNITEGDLLLLQREKKFNNIGEFLNTLEKSEEINSNKVAVYNYDLKTKYFLKDYKPSSNNLVINEDLRGAYQFYTYLDNEDLDFVFEFTDLNKNKDSDPIDLRLYFDNGLIKTQHLDDDGVVSDNGQGSGSRIMTLVDENMKTGLYKIEIKVNDDIVTKKIATKQSRLAFINGIRLHDNDGKNLAIYTDSQIIQAKTIFPALLQTLKVASDDLPLTETYKQFSLKIKKSSSSDMYSKILLEKDGLFLSGNGVFSFSPEALINPALKKVDSNIDIKNDGIDYILARYQKPTKNEDFKEASVEIDLRSAYRENDRYSFMLSIPSLVIDDGIADGISLDEIRIDLTGQSFLGLIKKFLIKI